MSSVKPGIQVLLEQRLDLLKGKNVGIITNQTGVLPDLTLNVDGIIKSHVNLRAIFAPEQGFRGAEQAGYSSGDYVDAETGIKVYTVYEKSPAEINATFDEAGVDTILYDLQDVGSRFYTYIWTLSDTMEAIVGTNKSLIVLDRPNPIGGVNVDGPVIQPGLESFVGRYPISLVHGMTTGEMAIMFNEVFILEKLNKKANLEVIWMEGWRRSMYYDETGLPFIFPSVNLPTLESVLVYPGQGLFEGIKVSQGRGTTHPFEIIGAPFIDYTLAKRLNANPPPGTHFLEAHFTPTFREFVNETCTGVQVYVKDRSKYNSIRTALDIITACRDLYPEKFGFGKTFDLLTGSKSVRDAIVAGFSTDAIIDGWQQDLETFKKLRAKYLHY
jgi:uncharacterized protein YbbC (DUF1343 family)